MSEFHVLVQADSVTNALSKAGLRDKATLAKIGAVAKDFDGQLLSVLVTEREEEIVFSVSIVENVVQPDPTLTQQATNAQVEELRAQVAALAARLGD